jgi:AcrR family transcriptional regulator
VGTRKDEILAVARTMFAERGYAVTSMRDIARATGILPGSLYAHFRSKAQFVHEIMTGFFDELLPRQQEAYDLEGTGAERFSAMIAAVYGVCSAREEEIRVVHHEWKVFVHLEELADVLPRAQRALDLWRDVIAEGVDDGSLQPVVDPELLMRVVTHSIYGILDDGRYEARDQPHGSLSPVELLQQAFLLGTATAPVSAASPPA